MRTARIRIRQKEMLGYLGWFVWELMKGSECLAVSNDSYPSPEKAYKAALRAKRLMASAEIKEKK